MSGGGNLIRQKSRPIIITEIERTVHKFGSTPDWLQLEAESDTTIVSTTTTPDRLPFLAVIKGKRTRVQKKKQIRKKNIF